MVERLDFQQQMRAQTRYVWVTPLVVLANVAVYVMMVVNGVDWFKPTVTDLFNWGGNFGPVTRAGEWWRLGSAMFVHGGLVHLLMNVLVIAAAGPYVERMVGNLGFLAGYLVAGLAGSALSMAIHPEMVSVGASGAAFGIYGMLFASLIWNWRVVPPAVRNNLLRGGAIFVVVNVLYGASVKGVDMWAHAGGLAGGFLVGLAVATRFGAPAFTRAWRALAAAVVAAAVLGGSAMALQQDDIKLAMSHASDVEILLRHELSQSLKQLKAKQLDKQAFAQQVQHELVPWRAEIQRVADLRLSGKEARVRDVALAYMRAVDSELTTLAAGSMDDDQELLNSVKAKTAERQRLEKEIARVAKE